MPRRVLTGPIVSDKADKTVVVKVERRFIHPVMGKTVRRSKKYHAHDEANAFRIGQVVRIEETAPISKLKTWQVLGQAEHGAAAAAPALEIASAEDILAETRGKPAEPAQAAEKPAETVELPAEQPVEKPADEPEAKPEKPAAKADEKADEKPGKDAEKPAKAAEKPAKAAKAAKAEKAPAKADKAEKAPAKAEAKKASKGKGKKA